MTVNFVTAALFTCVLLNWHDNNVFLTTNQILCFPRMERQQKLSSSHITYEIFGLSAVKVTPSLARLVRDTWEWNGLFLHVLQTS